jgi:membrane protein implicated in regulation of membrane protease activity
MSGGQVAALLFAILLLLPGGCFVSFGLNGLAIDNHNPNGFEPSLLLIGLGILAVAALLFWVAFRRRRGLPAANGGPPRVPPDDPAP